MRIGHGYDAHKFCDKKDSHRDTLMLGGVSIEYEKSMAAHSDGDVVIHALCDALLGAAGLGDIGKHFPDNDDRFKGIDSRILLRDVMAKLVDMKLTVSNADITIVAQAPRLAPYIDQMRSVLADDLSLDKTRLNIKATTTEGMGFAGRKEGIEVHAVVLLDE